VESLGLAPLRARGFSRLETGAARGLRHAACVTAAGAAKALGSVVLGCCGGQRRRLAAWSVSPGAGLGLGRCRRRLGGGRLALDRTTHRTLDGARVPALLHGSSHHCVERDPCPTTCRCHSTGLEAAGSAAEADCGVRHLAPSCWPTCGPQAAILHYRLCDGAHFAGPMDPALAGLGPTGRLPAPRSALSVCQRYKWILTLLEDWASAPAPLVVCARSVGGRKGIPTRMWHGTGGLGNVHLLGTSSLQALPAVLKGLDLACCPCADPYTQAMFREIIRVLAAGLPWWHGHRRLQRSPALPCCATHRKKLRHSHRAQASRGEGSG